MKQVRGGMQGVSLHYYTLGGTWQNKLPATGFGEDGWTAVLRDALKMEDLLTRAEAIMNREDPDGHVGLFVDEWGTWYQAEPGTNSAFLYQRNTVRDARRRRGDPQHPQSAHQAREDGQYRAVGQRATGVDPDRRRKDGADADLSCFRHVPGAPRRDRAAHRVEDRRLYPRRDGDPGLSASASRDAQGVVHLSLVNLDAKAPVALQARIEGGNLSEVSGRILTGDAMDSENTFDSPRQVRPAEFDGARLNSGGLAVQLPPHSVVVLTALALTRSQPPVGERGASGLRAWRPS